MADVADLVKFVETRSKFVAQTTLYGYVKTRAGTRYVSLFEDPVFARSLNIAKWEIYLACLCDLAVRAAACAGQRAGAGKAETEALAIGLVDAALAAEEIPEERPQGFDDIGRAFRKRAPSVDWDAALQPEGAFTTSYDALIEWAPIADELKILDESIVRTSMRHRWKKVRDQLDGLLQPAAVIADWRAKRPEGDSERSP